MLKLLGSDNLKKPFAVKLRSDLAAVSLFMFASLAASRDDICILPLFPPLYLCITRISTAISWGVRLLPASQSSIWCRTIMYRPLPKSPILDTVEKLGSQILDAAASQISANIERTCDEDGYALNFSFRTHYTSRSSSLTDCLSGVA